MIGNYHAIGVIASWLNKLLLCFSFYDTICNLSPWFSGSNSKLLFREFLMWTDSHTRFPKERIKPIWHAIKIPSLCCYRLRSGWTQNKGKKEMALAIECFDDTVGWSETVCTYSISKFNQNESFWSPMAVVKSDLCSVVIRIYSLQWKVHRLTTFCTWFSCKNLYIQNKQSEYTWMHSYQGIVNPTLCYRDSR